MHTLNFDHFDWLSSYYDKLFRLHNTDCLVQSADLPTQGALLDVGGGTGRISQRLVGMLGSIVIIDYSFGMLRQASKKDELQTVCGQSEKLPFSSESFERVIMVDALHHVFNQYDTLGELWRVLKPGGKIVIEEPDIRKLFVKLVAIIEKILMMRSHFLNPFRIANLIHHMNAKITVNQEGNISWVIIEKSA